MPYGRSRANQGGTGGEKLQEALVDQLAHKAIGFLGALNPTFRPPWFSPFSRLSAMPRFQVSLLIGNLPSTSFSSSVTPPSPSLASPLLFGKQKGWCPRLGSPYISSSHILSDVLLTLTSPGSYAMHYPHLQYASGQTVAMKFCWYICEL